MDWKNWGFQDFPLRTEPITQETLNLFVGRDEEILICNNLLNTRNRIIIIEGSRGIGTTSFANYIKFQKHKKKEYFAPRIEIGIETNTKIETILSIILSVLVKEIEIINPEIIKHNSKFLETKAIIQRISEVYKTVGIGAFGFSGQFGRNETLSQPFIVPAMELLFHFENLINIVLEMGYKNGVIIHFNNLDINTVHSDDYLKYLFNSLRDYMQIKNTNWFLVGDEGLSNFISQKVDRLDDIITHTTYLAPLNKNEFHKLIKKRLEFFSENNKYLFPLEEEVIDFLYDITNGRIRYIFGLIDRLMANLQYTYLIATSLDLNFVKPKIKQLALNRIKRHPLSEGEEFILKIIINQKTVIVSEIIKISKKQSPYVSKVLKALFDKNLVVVQKDKTKRIYSPSLDAKIAYMD